MGMFGNRKPLSAAQQVAAGGDGINPSAVPHKDPRNQLFGDGGVSGIAGGIGKLLAFGPFAGMAQDGMNRRRQLEDSNMAYKDAMAQHAMAPPPTDIMREAAAMGYQPGTPQFAKFVTDYRMKQPMIVLGSGEGGQTVIDPRQMGGGAPAPMPAPKPGDLMDGHIFLGGDPANPASWKAQ